MTTGEFQAAAAARFAATIITAGVVQAPGGWIAACVAAAFPVAVIGQLYLGLNSNYYGAVTMTKELAAWARRKGYSVL